MPTLPARTVEFKYLAAPSIKIQATALNDPAWHSAYDGLPNLIKVWREVVDKILQQCMNATPAAYVPMDDLEVDENGNLSFDPRYKVLQPLGKVSDGTTAIAEIDVTYYVTDCTFQISAWAPATPAIMFSNSDKDDPRLIKEVLARILKHYKTAATSQLMLTVINENIKLTA